jgi:hypothetical protein
MLEVERKSPGRGAKTFLTRTNKVVKVHGRDIADCDYSEALIGPSLTFYESRRLNSESTQRLAPCSAMTFRRTVTSNAE